MYMFSLGPNRSMHLPTTSHANTWQAHKHFNNRPFSSQIHHARYSIELTVSLRIPISWGSTAKDQAYIIYLGFFFLEVHFRHMLFPWRRKTQKYSPFVGYKSAVSVVFALVGVVFQQLINVNYSICSFACHIFLFECEKVVWNVTFSKHIHTYTEPNPSTALICAWKAICILKHEETCKCSLVIECSLNILTGPVAQLPLHVSIHCLRSLSPSTRSACVDI